MAAPQLALSSSSSALSSSSSVAGRLRRAISRTLSAGLKPVTRLPSASRAVPRCEWRAAVRTGESSESLESRFIPLAPPPPLRAVPRCGWQAAARTLAALTLAALTLAAVERARELAARAASASKSSESLESRFTPQVPPPPLRAVPRCGWQAAARTLAALTLAAVERARELAARAASASKSSESLESRFTPQAPPPPLRAVPRCWWQAAVRTGESSELLELEQEAAQAREGRVAVRRHEAVAAKAAPAAAAGLLDLSWVAAAARIGEPSESLELVVAVAPGRLVRRRGGARQAAVIAARRLELVTRLKRRSTAESEVDTSAAACSARAPRSPMLLCCRSSSRSPPAAPALASSAPAIAAAASSASLLCWRPSVRSEAQSRSTPASVGPQLSCSPLESSPSVRKHERFSPCASARRPASPSLGLPPRSRDSSEELLCSEVPS